MDRRNIIVVDSPDVGDVTPEDLHELVEHLHNGLPQSEIHAAWEDVSTVRIEEYWPEIIVWVVGDKDLIDTTVRVILITKATEAVLKRMGKVCIKLARFTSDNAGKVFRKVYIESGKDPVDESLSEDEQEPVTKSPIRE
jgi:hypothetical protein